MTLEITDEPPCKMLSLWRSETVHQALVS